MRDIFPTMTSPDITGEEWLRCPICRKKIMKLLPDTVGHSIQIYCRSCRREFAVDIHQSGTGHSVLSRPLERS